MQDAINQSVDGKHIPITAGPNAPQTAICPECGGSVVLRKRKRMDGKITWFYRHTTTRSTNDCSRRYWPT